MKVIPIEEQIVFLYMAAQQQHFVNCALEDAEERVLKQCDVSWMNSKNSTEFQINKKNSTIQVQLEQLSTMVQSKKKELARAESTIKILEQHTTLSKIESALSTTLNEMKSNFKNVITKWTN